jgi:hypothetical protein
MTARRISRNVQQRPSPIVAPELSGSDRIGSGVVTGDLFPALPCRPWFRFVSVDSAVSLVGRAGREGEKTGGGLGVVPLRRC